MIQGSSINIMTESKKISTALAEGCDCPLFCLCEWELILILFPDNNKTENIHLFNADIPHSQVLISSKYTMCYSSYN
jgi:hypothetical protein